MQSKIAWLVPYPLKGSGGHRTIFSHIRNLEARGHQCHVYIGEEAQQDMSEEVIRELVEEYFGLCPSQIHCGYEVAGHFDMAIATAWWTAELVAKNVDADHKLYFVQDFEACFHPMGDCYIRAESSYGYGLTPLTIGRWLSHLLHKNYGSKANFFEFTADHTIYFPLESEVREQAVCFIYQPEKPRRCPSIGRDTLAIVKHHCPEVTIYTYGCNEEPDYHFDHTHLGILSLEECNRLYNRCGVGLCLSSSNPSRIPFEMMAAGLPAVDFFGENTIYDLPEGCTLLAERTPSSLAGAIIKILQSPQLQKEMRRSGLRFMGKRPASLEFDQCAAGIEELLAGKPVPEADITPLYTSKPFFAELDAPPPVTSPPGNEYPAKMTLWEYLQHNRISRALKVLCKGHCQ